MTCARDLQESVVDRLTEERDRAKDRLRRMEEERAMREDGLAAQHAAEMAALREEFATGPAKLKAEVVAHAQTSQKVLALTAAAERMKVGVA